MIAFVIEAMVDAVVVVEADGQISMANSGAEHLSGFTREELVKMSISDLLGDESSGLRTIVRQRIAGGDVVRREQAWLATKSRERVPVSVTGSAVLDDDGALQGIVVVARDTREIQQLLTEKEAEITRRRIAEDELRTAKQSIETQLAEVRRMLLLAERRATLGTLAGGVGHELRNIAQIQVAAVDELQISLDEGEDMAARVAELLPDLQRVADHITLHGTKLMQLARPGPDHVAPLDLNEVVADVASMLRLAGKLGRVELAIVASPAPLNVTVNRSRIEQILVNLVINAVDAMADRTGAITISVRATASGERVACEVRDTGLGIAPAHLDRIFEPFFTTKDDGTGLGLPVVREIITSYGGSLDVRSEVGKGTTFTFELPR